MTVTPPLDKETEHHATLRAVLNLGPAPRHHHKRRRDGGGNQPAELDSARAAAKALASPNADAEITRRYAEICARSAEVGARSGEICAGSDAAGDPISASEAPISAAADRISAAVAPISAAADRISAAVAPCSLRVAVQRSPVYLCGRYRKLSRSLPQSPWVLDGKRKCEGSVQARG